MKNDVDTVAMALAEMDGGTPGSIATDERSVNTAALARFMAGEAVNAQRATRPFEQVGVVNRCIRLRGDALKSMPLMISTRDDELVEAGEIMDLINCPYPGMTTEDLIEWIDALVMLTGACYLIAEDQAGGVPIRVRPVGRSSCQPKYAADGELSHYNYRKPGDQSGKSIRLEIEEVIPFTLSNYQTEKLHDGLAQLGPARQAIQQVFAADTANLESLYNGVEPGLVFDFGPGSTPTDEQRKLIYRQLDENHGGPSKRNRPIITGGGATVQDFIKRFTEMEFSKLKSMSIVDVCVSLGVPPLVAGYGGEAGMGHGKELEEAHQVFWQITTLPMAAWIARKLTINLLPRFQNRSRTFNGYAPIERHRLRSASFRRARLHARRHRTEVRGAGRQPLELFAWFDSSAVDAVRDSAIRRSKEASIWVEKFGATPADVIEALDLPIPDDHAWQQTWYKPMGMVDVQDESLPALPGDDDLPGPPEAPAPEDTENDDDDETGKATPPGTRKLLEHIDRITESQLAQLWQQWRTSWAGIERTFRSRHSRLIQQWRSETLRNLDRVMASATSMGGDIKRELIGEIVFDLVAADKTLVARLGGLIRTAAMLGGEQTMTEAAAAEDRDDPEVFNITDPRVEQRIRQRMVRVKDTTRTTRRLLADSLAEGFANNETAQQLGERVRQQFNFAGSRAKGIARDHVGGAVEDARHEGRRQASVPSKSWLWSRKETGRPWHMEAEQTTRANPIPNDALFTMTETGDQTPYPRGPGLKAKDTANCACTTLSRYPDDSIKDARMFNHLAARGFFSDNDLARRIEQRATQEAH